MWPRGQGRAVPQEPSAPRPPGPTWRGRHGLQAGVGTAVVAAAPVARALGVSLAARHLAGAGGQRARGRRAAVGAGLQGGCPLGLRGEPASAERGAHRAAGPARKLRNSPKLKCPRPSTAERVKGSGEPLCGKRLAQCVHVCAHMCVRRKGACMCTCMAIRKRAQMRTRLLLYRRISYNPHVHVVL